MITPRGKLSLLLLCGTCAGVALAGRGRAQDARTAAPPTNVLITNTAAAPVPVTGTVGLNGSANLVKAQQLGQWNVGISNIPSVKQNGPWNVGLSPTANTVKLDPVTSGVKATQAGTWNVSVVNPAASPVPVHDPGDTGIVFARGADFHSSAAGDEQH